jgi:hypothetical protein
MILGRPTDLRAQLAAVISTSQAQQHPQQQQQQQQHLQQPRHPQQHPRHSHGYNEGPASSSTSPREHNIDPSIAGPGGMMSAGGGDSGDDSLGDGRKGGKRELSQSKRAAQNRAAQVCLDRIFVVVDFAIREMEQMSLNLVPFLI